MNFPECCVLISKRSGDVTCFLPVTHPIRQQDLECLIHGAVLQGRCEGECVSVCMRRVCFNITSSTPASCDLAPSSSRGECCFMFNLLVKDASGFGFSCHSFPAHVFLQSVKCCGESSFTLTRSFPVLCVTWGMDFLVSVCVC